MISATSCRYINILSYTDMSILDDVPYEKGCHFNVKKYVPGGWTDQELYNFYYMFIDGKKFLEKFINYSVQRKCTIYKSYMLKELKDKETES